ncbi:MAG: sulfotransferase [Candidatus Thermoplasmatota archaeon]|nr:sulfotransferase [Candidatus Thermoplasmatota archaeon]
MRQNNNDKKYIKNLKNISFSPIFILGLQRSGTSILYKILQETNEFNTTTFYHLLNFNQLLYNFENNLEQESKKNLDQYLHNLGLSNRGIDDIIINANYVHEYPYLFAKQHYPRMITQKNQWLSDLLCKKIMYISKNNNPILLISTHENQNFLKLKEIYPNAKFIFIHRNPLFQISSSLKAWQYVFTKKNIFTAILSDWYDKNYQNPLFRLIYKIYYSSPMPPGLFEIIYHTKKSTQYYLGNIKKLDESDYISITYEKLCESPKKIFNNLKKFLDIENTLDIKQYINPRNPELTKEVKILKQYIFNKMEPYFKNFEYTVHL